MYDSNVFDPVTGFIVVVAVAVLVVGIQLWRGRRLKQVNRVQTAHPRHPADDAGADQDNQPPHRRPGWPQAIQEVNRLLIQCQRFSNGHDYAALQSTAEQALRTAVTRLSPDHWLVGLSLDWLGHAEMAQGRHYDALKHLEAAALILSEWTQHEAHCRKSLLPRISTCRQMLGFDQS